MYLSNKNGQSARFFSAYMVLHFAVCRIRLVKSSAREDHGFRSLFLCSWRVCCLLRVTTLGDHSASVLEWRTESATPTTFANHRRRTDRTDHSDRTESTTSAYLLYL